MKDNHLITIQSLNYRRRNKIVEAEIRQAVKAVTEYLARIQTYSFAELTKDNPGIPYRMNIYTEFKLAAGL